MSLQKYKEKRSVKETPEPFGGKAAGKQLRFVIQKHAASHLHYDFRLEMEGVLKSWAVPKGPSTDPSVKRLAMMVEDHPYDYRTFEGIIPEGQYGGGTVIVWDEGTYEPIEDITGKKAQDKALLKQLAAGSLKFRLHGKKLQGEFALVKTHGMGKNGWLLIKHRDEHASTADITLKDKSVISNKNLEQVKKTTTNIYGQKPKKVAKEKVIKEKVIKEKPSPVKKLAVKVASLLKKTKVKKFPTEVSPMLTTLVDKPFNEPGWSYEIKWDGYRTLAFINKGKVELKSRNDKSFNDKFYAVHDAVKKWKVNTIVDGEIVVLNDKGLSDFGALQNWRSEADGELVFYVFDILWLGGKDVTGLPLSDRRRILQGIMPKDNSIIRLSETFDGSGLDFFQAAIKIGLEGIIAKKLNSVYEVNERSREWLKIKANKRQEVVIGGYTKNKGSDKPFSSLLVGVFEGTNLQYTGKIGTGFSIKTQKEILAKLKPLEIKKTPFNTLPDINKPSRFRPDPPQATATWVKPKLVCEVSFTEMTSDQVMRHPSFEGMRIDKEAKQVVLEVEKDTAQLTSDHKQLRSKKVLTSPGKKDRKTFLNPTDESQVRHINDHEMKFTNLSKLYWPKEKITKRDMLNYYYQVAPYMLPYLKDRPHSLHRQPDGITGESFYQKDIKGKSPDWITKFPYHSEGDKRDKEFLVCTDEASLLYMASQGCIEIHPWHSRKQQPDNPDWCVIDLDPDKNSFDQVIKAAQVTHEVLELLSVPSYCKTSGSTGLHIYIPLGAKYSYEQSKEFCRSIVTIVHSELPKFTTVERHIADRDGKMYLDFLQNRPQATIAAPYSLRPKLGATVSMPLHWDEVKKGLKMKDFTIHNAIDRIRGEGDIFKPVLGKGINLEKILKKLSSI